MEYGATAYNRSVYAAPQVGGLASIRRGQSLRSFPRLIPAHFASPGLCCAKPFYARPNVVNSRYVPFESKIYKKHWKILDKMK
jgi:hypothetical protein